MIVSALLWAVPLCVIINQLGALSTNRAEAQGGRPLETLGKYLRSESIDQPRRTSIDRPPSRPYPGVFQAVGLLVLLVGVVIFLAIPIAIFSFVGHNKLIASPVVGVIVDQVANAIIIAWGFRKTKASLREVFPFNPLRPALLFPIILCVLGLGIVSSNFVLLVKTMFPPPDWVTSSFIDLLRTRYGLAFLSVEFLVMAPITEELLFRGLLLHGFLPRYGEARGVLASAILFGAFHTNLWQFSSAVLGGLLLGWLFVETRSLVPCMIGHAINNLFPLVLSFLVIRNPHGRIIAALGPHPIEPPWLVLTGAAVLAVGAYSFVRTARMKPVTSTRQAQTNAGGICNHD